MNQQNQKSFLIEIRDAKDDDIPEINDLINHSIDFFHKENYHEEAINIWKRGYSPNKLKEQISNRKSLVLEVSGEICGFAQFDMPEIKGFYINPKFKGQGFGKILMEYMLAFLKKKEHKQVELTSNKLALGFYQKMGFQLLNEEIVYWENYPFIEYRMVKILNNQ